MVCGGLWHLLVASWWSLRGLPVAVVVVVLVALVQGVVLVVVVVVYVGCGYSKHRVES